MSGILQLIGEVCSPIFYALFKVTGIQKLLQIALLLDKSNYRALGEKYSRKDHDASAQARFLLMYEFLAYNRDVSSQELLDVVADCKAHLLQDVFAWKSRGKRQAGFFVEVGVGDGERISNTFLLEKRFGWTGLLVEPNKGFHGSIKAIRKSELVEEAAFHSDGETLKFLQATDGEFSGLEVAHVDRNEKRAQPISEYAVNANTLTSVLDRYDAPNEIDYVSIDTEGSEFEVLQGIDFQRYDIKVITVEHNYESKKLAKVDALLLSHGYERVLERYGRYEAFYLKKTEK